jgi:hypothetical protein
LSVANPDIYRDEVTDMLVDVLLHGIAPINVGANLAEHLVPRAPNLGMQKAPEWSQVFIELAIAVPGTRAELHRPFQVIAQPNGGRVTIFPAPRSLDYHFVHVSAHRQLRIAKSPRQESLPGLVLSREANCCPIGFG